MAHDRPNADLLEGIFDALPIAASWATLPDARIKFVNRAFISLFGYPQHFFRTANQFVDTVYSDREQRVELLRLWSNVSLDRTAGLTEIADVELDVVCFDGSARVVRHRGVILHERRIAIAIFEDITEEKRLHGMLMDSAQRDPLTGLGNRRRLEERWRQATAQPRVKSGIAFLMLDLDGFKPVNDTHGHHAGDIVLKAVAARLRSAVRPKDLVCRLGGDEFGVLLPAPADFAEIDGICDRLIAAIEEPIRVDRDACVRVGASIGACLYPHGASSLRELMLRADQALYEVKSTRKGQWRWHARPLAAATDVPVLLRRARPS